MYIKQKTLACTLAIHIAIYNKNYKVSDKSLKARFDDVFRTFCKYYSFKYNDINIILYSLKRELYFLIK